MGTTKAALPPGRRAQVPGIFLDFLGVKSYSGSNVRIEKGRKQEWDSMAPGVTGAVEEVSSQWSICWTVDR
jgi:hypothetical protein